jgi:ubiquinone/menaquinone biosynthesis C-methylase UbiE
MLTAARLYDAVLAGTERCVLGPWRRELLATVTGDVLEVGAGTGANVSAYGPDVRRLVLLEPDPGMRARLTERVRRTRPLDTIVVAGSASRLPIADHAVNEVVATLVLCSIGNVEGALAEIRRVLRPGGRLHRLEHVAAQSPGLRRAQHLVTPLWSRMAGGCSLERPTRDLLVAAGFDVSDLRDDTLQVPIPLVRPALRGSARPIG